MRSGWERGSGGVQLAVLAPAIALMLGLLVFVGRYVTAVGVVNNAASMAARAASLERTSTAATLKAREVAQTFLFDEGITCLSTSVSVDASQFARPVGQTATTTVEVSCDADFADLVPGAPGSLTLTGSASSALDTYRERA